MDDNEAFEAFINVHRERIREECAVASAAGLHWTLYRKMRPPEWFGAFYCGSCSYPPKRKRKRSEYVSYAVDGFGRTVLCADCHVARGGVIEPDEGTAAQPAPIRVLP